jgi:uncharacterized phage protein (TIGR02218 family)
MSRTIPPLLQTHLDQDATTTTRLLKITLRSGFVYGLCMLDRDITYDDGAGAVDYIATNGFDPSTLSSDVGYSVANAEGKALISNDIEGIDIEDVEAGELDDAQWVMYLVNFEDLTMGHAILDAGDLGEVKTKHGMVWTPELLSYIMRLKQPIGSAYSRRCRAVFGSPANTQTGCGFDVTPLWANGTVQSVGAETSLVFVGDVLSNDSPQVDPVPGRVQFLTGANAGREFAVEAVAGLQVTLSEPTNYAIAPGDTYRIREDCRKRFIEDCRDRWDNAVNFKGEPLIPVGDAAGVQSPGAQLGRGAGFVAPPEDDGD